MGALHDGHATLIRAAADETDLVVTTIFVNPLQFAAHEDLGAYPQALIDDERIAEAAGAAILFCPTVEEMYPHGSAEVMTKVSVRGITSVLDGVHRPGHFDGVATVVAKLFAMSGACVAFFGEKDFQQLAVIRRMNFDLSFPVRIVGVPTVREANGLAMSSRNRYLTHAEREGASIIFQSLSWARSQIEAGRLDYETIRAEAESRLASSPVVSSVDYVAIVNAATFAFPSGQPDEELRVLAACRVGKARLIDNV